MVIPFLRAAGIDIGAVPPLRSNGRAKYAFSLMRARLMHYCNGLETFETTKARERRSLIGCAQPDKADKHVGGQLWRHAQSTQNYVCPRSAFRRIRARSRGVDTMRSEEHTSELQSRGHLVC